MQTNLCEAQLRQLVARIEWLEKQNESMRQELDVMKRRQENELDGLTSAAGQRIEEAPKHSSAQKSADSGQHPSRRSILYATILGAVPTFGLRAIRQQPATPADGIQGNFSSNVKDAHAVTARGTNAADGVVASSDHAFGVYAETIDSTAVFGKSTSVAGNGIGVVDLSATGIGIVAQGGATNIPTLSNYVGSGIFAYAPTRSAIYAQSDSGSGLTASSTTGIGGVFSGEAGAVRLVPTTANAHPKSGQQGTLSVDRHGRLWYCKADRPTPEWVRLA